MTWHNSIRIIHGFIYNPDGHCYIPLSDLKNVEYDSGINIINFKNNRSIRVSSMSLPTARLLRQLAGEE